MDMIEIVNRYGFPILAALGMGYLVYYVWTWVTRDIKPVLSIANQTLVKLIDRIRVLDNDLIRLHEKTRVVLQLRGRLVELERAIAEQEINRKKDSA
jgi:hypothetical protein